MTVTIIVTLQNFVLPVDKAQRAVYVPSALGAVISTESTVFAPRPIVWLMSKEFP